MGFGVLDDHHLEHVPGTALLEDLHSTAIQGVDASKTRQNWQHYPGSAGEHSCRLI